MPTGQHPWIAQPWQESDLHLYGLRSALDGGCIFCGVTEEQFAINGVTYQWPRGSRLTWGIAFSRLGQLSDMDVKDAVDQALREISECCDVTHEYVANPNAANLKITTQKLDGPSGVLADFQIPVGNVNPATQLIGRMDDSEHWGIFEDPPQGSIDFYRVILHELEHGHGLGHKPANVAAPALIAPIYSPLIGHLQDADRAELIRRYGPAKTSPTPTPAPPIGDSVGVDLIITAANGAKYQAKGNAKRVA